MRHEDKTTENEWVFLTHEPAKESGPRSSRQLSKYGEKYGIQSPHNSDDIISAMYAFVRDMKDRADKINIYEAPEIVAQFKARLSELIVAYRSETSTSNHVPSGINAVNTFNADGLVSVLISNISLNKEKTTNAVLVLFLCDLLNERTNHDLALENPYDATDSNGNPALFCDEPRTIKEPSNI